MLKAETLTWGLLAAVIAALLVWAAVRLVSVEFGGEPQSPPEFSPGVQADLDKFERCLALLYKEGPGPDPDPVDAEAARRYVSSWSEMIAPMSEYHQQVYIAKEYLFYQCKGVVGNEYRYMQLREQAQGEAR